ncbi:MAG: hypothetical protein PHC90_08355 [Syntrophorhabdaceae bacterium]|nr:hypothetical protein [Syntrophorhabdaceae bacterium]
MTKGDKVTFSFAKKTMEGTVEAVFTKTVYIKADFPKDKGKIIKRKINDLK